MCAPHPPGPDRKASTVNLLTACGIAFLAVFVLLSLLAGVMAWHFWRVRKAGGLVIPHAPGEAPPDPPKKVPSLPDLLLRETVVAMALIAVVMLLAIFFDAPLDDPANPGLSPNPTKAPWYFAGIQELLLHLHVHDAVVVARRRDGRQHQQGIGGDGEPPVPFARPGHRRRPRDP